MRILRIGLHCGFEQLGRGRRLSLADEHVGPQQRDLAVGDVGRLLERVEKAVDRRPVAVGGGPLQLRRDAQLQERIPDLGDRGEPVARDRRRHHLELLQGIVRLAGCDQCRRRADAGCQRRRVVGEHATIGLELLVEFAELLVALSEVEIDLPGEIGRSGHERPHAVELLLGLQPALAVMSTRASRRPTAGLVAPSTSLSLPIVCSTRSISFVCSNASASIMSSEGLPGMARQAFVEHLDGHRRLLPLEGEHRGGPDHPLVACRRLHPGVDQFLGCGEVFFGERHLERRQHCLDIVGSESASLGHILLGGGEVAALPMPAGECEPGLGIVGVGLHEFREDSVGGARVVELFLEDRRQEDERVGAVQDGLSLGIERLCFAGRSR